MLDVEQVRACFPALASGAVFFDNPGGTQVAQPVVERMNFYLLHTNANHGGTFRTSQDSDAIVAEARRAVADFLNASRSEEIIFGQNMTSLTFHMSRSLARRLQPGDEIVVTRLDHDANVAPWLLIAQDRGCTVRWVNFHHEDCTLDMDELERQITPRTKIVALGYASNAVGTVHDVQRAVRLAHRVGALCYIDAVQYAPHKPIDVQALDCDFLACSAYKFFGPHTGILYGKYALLDELTAYKVRPSGKMPPDKFETGTQSFESIAGVLGAIEYFEWVGTTFGQQFAARYQLQYPEAGRKRYVPFPLQRESIQHETLQDQGEKHQGQFNERRLALKQAMAAIEAYELELNHALLEGLQSIPGLQIRGITDRERMHLRVPTFSFTRPGKHPRQIAEELAQQGIYVWDGNFYAYEAERALGLVQQGGFLRIGLTHYNTLQEIDRLIAAL